jgi:uncharacterized membrane protein
MLKFTDVLLQLVEHVCICVCVCVCVYSLNVNEIWNADLLKRITVFSVWFKQFCSKKGTVVTNIVLTSLRSLLINKITNITPTGDIRLSADRTFLGFGFTCMYE